MKDYSQHKESTFIYNYIKNNNLNITKFVVEIGGLDGVTNSNSRMFIEQGWKGLIVEPNPNSYFKLVNNTKQFKNNVQTFQVAITDKFETQKFEIVTKNNFAGHSNINNKGTYTVLCLPIDMLVKEQVGIMSIDAEGYDTRIVDYIINKTNIRPQILMVENISRVGQRDQKQLQADLLSNEYEFIAQIKVNGIWKLKTFS